jgi:hypothetical protein
VDDFLYAHFNNDYYDRNDPTDGRSLSDHYPGRPPGAGRGNPPGR